VYGLDYLFEQPVGVPLLGIDANLVKYFACGGHQRALDRRASEVNTYKNLIVRLASRHWRFQNNKAAKRMSILAQIERSRQRPGVTQSINRRGRLYLCVLCGYFESAANLFNRMSISLAVS
jgi:hypothetical protein